MLRNLKIGTRIGLGFFLVLLVSGLMVAYAIRELRSGSESFKTYRSLARASVLSGRVQANMLIASNAAKDFLDTHDEQRLGIFRERFQSARTFAREQQIAIEDPSRREMSRELVESLDNYGIAAEEVIHLMRHRDAVLKETLNPRGKLMRESLTLIMVSAYQDDDSEAAYVAGRALERVLLGRLYMLKFLEDNDDSEIIRVRTELGSGFQQAFTEMENAIENPKRKQLLQQFSAARDIYVAAFEDIVTTIKNRNTVITQRMKPLEQSVADISEQIKLSLKSEQDTLGPLVQERKEATVRAVLIGSAIAIPLAILIALSVIRAVTAPIAELIETMGSVQESGDLEKRSTVKSIHEIGIMAKTLNAFLASLQSRAEVADNVAHGILGTPIELRSKNDTLGIALQKMTATLKHNAEDEAVRQWLHTGQSQFNDEIRGVLDSDVLSERVISCLAKYFSAQVGVLYLQDDASGHLRFAAGYGLSSDNAVALGSRDGDGLLKQIASDRKPVLIDQVPADYVKIESALGQSSAASLILFPLVYDQRLIGVIELASFEPFEQRHLEFLSSIEENACVSLRAAQNQVELRQLLAQTKQQAIFFRVFKDATDPIVLEDLSGEVLDLNAAAESAYGWTKEELMGHPIKRIIPDDCRQQAGDLRQRCLAGGKVGDAEGYRITRDGNVYDVLITLSLIRNENDKPIAIASIAKDVTALFKARQAAEEANRAKSDFLANMSHEIRTPMNGIMGMTELALGTDLNREQREFLTTIESSAESLLALINDILDFSKIESKKLELDPINFEIRERISETLSTLASRAHSKGLELAFAVADDVPEWIMGDVHRIRQIIINLLGNAIKFTEQGEIVLSVETIGQVTDNVTLRFLISDTGIGLPADKLDSIFLPFEQADASTTRKYGGTGLGLTICVQLVNLMDGEMKVESELGRGTTFSFTAKLQVGQPESSRPRIGTSVELDGLRVLVVDDNQTNRRILSRMLQNWGMSAVVAESAAEGLAKLRTSSDEKPIQLVISDVNMPEMDGFMLAEQILSDCTFKKTPIILLTSADRTGDDKRCREMGIAAHLIKPARQSFLLDAIATSMGAPPSETVPRQQDDSAALPTGELRILLAEDNEVNQKFAVRSLSKAGHSVEVAINGKEAVKAWNSQPFDVVLMDVQMPIMDGYIATAEIRRLETASGRHTPIIAMTANAMKGDKEKCLEAGMDGYVTKPIKSKVMLAEIARVLHNAVS